MRIIYFYQNLKLILKRSVFFISFILFVNFAFAGNLVGTEDQIAATEKIASKKSSKFNYSLDLFSSAKLDFDGVTAGGRIKLPFYEIRTYFLNEEWTFGASIFTNNFCKKIPFSVKIGKLLPGGNYSKLKSPLLSTSVSPFSAVSESVKYFSCNLPSYSSFDNGLSSFFQLDYYGKTEKLADSKKLILKNLKFTTFYNFEKSNEFATSLYLNFALKNLGNLSASYILGKFLYDQNESSSWFNDEKYYKTGSHFCSNFQIGLKLPKLFSTVSINVYENPFGKFDHIYKMENKFKFSRFVYNLSVLYNSNRGVITTSDKTINEILELKTGIQYNFSKKIFVPVFFKFGINSYLKFNLADETHALKVGVGIQANSLITSISLVAMIYADLQTPIAKSFEFDFTTFSLQLKNPWYFNNFTITLTTGFIYSPKEDVIDFDENISENYFLGMNNGSTFIGYSTSQKVSINFSYNDIPLLTCTNTLNISQKNGYFEKSSFESSINAKFKIKNMSVTTKFSMKFDF